MTRWRAVLIPDRKSWHPQEIMAAVRMRGTTMQGLARRHGFAPTTFNKALRMRMPHAHAVIARFIGCSRHEIWPHWYSVDDQPLFRMRRDRHRPQVSS
jgi:Ner family transcriptional regulator